jgi:hypothetical protein
MIILNEHINVRGVEEKDMVEMMGNNKYGEWVHNMYGRYRSLTHIYLHYREMIDNIIGDWTNR